MKQLHTILVAVLFSFAFIACSSDDDAAADVDTNLLVGEWAMSGLDYNSTSTITLLGQSAESEVEGVGSNFDYTLTFNEDNTLVADGSYDVTITGSTDGVELSEETTSVTDTNATGTYSLDGNEITYSGFVSAQVDNDIFSGEQDETTSTITVLNENTLVIRTNFDDNLPVDLDLPDGVDFEIDGTNTVTFTRVN